MTSTKEFGGAFFRDTRLSGPASGQRGDEPAAGNQFQPWVTNGHDRGTDMQDDQTSICTLKDILEGTKLFLGEDGAVYSQFVRENQKVTYNTFSRDLMTWLKGEAVQRLNIVPSSKLIKQAINEIEYKLYCGNLPYPVATRIHAEPGEVLIDARSGKVLVIDGKGAHWDTDPGVIFPTREAIQSLPEPKSGDVLEVLPQILDVSKDECLSLLIWLMAQFQPDGRYPLLIICGPRQSGKTRLATNMRKLFDPCLMPLLPLPKDREELKSAVVNNAILAFDNVETIPDWIVADLLALAEGTAFPVSGRPRAVWCKRSTILVCKDLPETPALMENAFILRLKERPAAQIQGKQTLDRLFDEQHAKALGSLIQLCGKTLGLHDAIELTAVHKDADLEKWILAVDKSLELGGKLMTIFIHNLEQTIAAVIAERPAVRAFMALVKAKGSVRATATELLAQIDPFLDGPKDVHFPTSGKSLAKILRDHSRFMDDIEIEFNVRTGKDRDRNIVATWTSPRTGEGINATKAVKATGKHKKDNGEVSGQPTLI
jgi:hypothetical protein